MNNNYTFENLIDDVFKKEGKPLTSSEIWSSSIEYKLDEKLGSSGKTPYLTIYSILYTEIKVNGEKSKYIKITDRPARFFFRDSNIDLSKYKIRKPKL